ncbi:MAG: hypothetical protein ABR518_08010 [Actinomycetota bacterium]
MPFWRYVDSSGVSVGRSDDFAGQPEAERWLGDEWQELLDGGVETVELVDGDDLVYRMSLREEDG